MISETKDEVLELRSQVLFHLLQRQNQSQESENQRASTLIKAIKDLILSINDP